MPKISFTPAQNAAVTYKDENLLLSAAAGSGKTAALTGRIVNLIRNGNAELSEMLIVTYTRAAAGEIRARIARTLRDELEEEADSVISRRLSRAISQIPSADISTIHSFLYQSLRPYFPTLGVPQDSRIVDETKISSIRREIMRDTVDDLFAKADPPTCDTAGFAELCDIIGQTRDTTAIDEELMWLADRLTSGANDASSLSSLADSLSDIAGGKVKFMDTPYGKVIRDRTNEIISHYKKVFDTLAVEMESAPKVMEKYGPALESIIEWLEAAQKASDYDELSSMFRSYKPTPLGRLSSKDASEESERFKYFRDELKKEVAKCALGMFSGSASDISSQASRTARILRCTADVLCEYFTRLEKRKRAQSIIDYGDLEVLAGVLFTGENDRPSTAAIEIGKRYRYVFIDEYQDTNHVQDRIFRLISQNSVRFMVGDIKQSIYRFRGAEPGVFAEYRNRWEIFDPTNVGDDTETFFSPDGGRSLYMSENFRCSKPIVDFVNLVSGYILPHGGISYGDADALIYAKNGSEAENRAEVEVCLIEKVEKSDDDIADDQAEPDERNPEAVYVARRIAEMIGKYSPDGEHILTPGDVAILLRSPSSSGRDYEEELEKLGIPSVIRKKKPLSEYASVMLAVCLLNFVDNPLRDVYTAGALRSPIFGFNVADLARLRDESGELPLYTALREYAISPSDECNDDLAEKCRSAVVWLERHKTMSRGMSADKYLEFLIRDTSLTSLSGIMGNGQERDALNALCQMARSFESENRGLTRSGGISGFLDSLEEKLSAESDGSGGTGESRDAVAILSIHASKGLEYPVCFLAECAKKRNTADESRTILYDEILGLGMFLPDDGGLMKCDTVLRRVISQKIRLESVNEEMRMLYVALTRARSKLIITAKVKDADAVTEKLRLESEFTDSYRITSRDSYIDWILGAACGAGHDIRVLRAGDILESKLPSADVTGDDSAYDDNTAAEADEIRKRFDFTYSRGYLDGIPSKLTVSRLSPEILDEGESPVLDSFTIDESANAESMVLSDEAGEAADKAPTRPRFMTGMGHSASERGTATHLFMQFADFGRLCEYGVDAEIERLISEKFISRGSADLIERHHVRRFVESGLMDKLRRSSMVEREFRFNVLMDAARFTSDTSRAELLDLHGVKVTVQGVVDCVFRDPDSGKLVLVDYKTDSIRPDEWKDQRRAEERLRARHKNQLSYYLEICSEMFGEKIDAALIYSTPLGRCIKV